MPSRVGGDDVVGVGKSGGDATPAATVVGRPVGENEGGFGPTGSQVMDGLAVRLNLMRSPHVAGFPSGRCRSTHAA